jgi:hypothetical protein
MPICRNARRALVKYQYIVTAVVLLCYRLQSLCGIEPLLNVLYRVVAGDGNVIQVKFLLYEISC